LCTLARRDRICLSYFLLTIIFQVYFFEFNKLTASDQRLFRGIINYQSKALNNKIKVSLQTAS